MRTKHRLVRAAIRLAAMAFVAAFAFGTVATRFAEAESGNPAPSAPTTVVGVVESFDNSILVLADGKVIVLDGALPNGTAVTTTVDISHGDLVAGASVSVVAVAGAGTADDPLLASAVTVLPAPEPTPTVVPTAGATPSPTVESGEGTDDGEADDCEADDDEADDDEADDCEADDDEADDDEADDGEADTGDSSRIKGRRFEVRGTLTAIEGNKHTIKGVVVVADPEAVPELVLSGNLAVGVRVRAKGLVRAATDATAGQTLFATEIKALEAAGEGVQGEQPEARVMFHRHSFEIRGTLTALEGDSYTINGVKVIADASKVPHLQLRGNLVVGANVVARGIVVRAGAGPEASPSSSSSATTSETPSPAPTAAAGTTANPQPAAGGVTYYATAIRAVESGDKPEGAKAVVELEKKTFKVAGTLSAIVGNVYTIQGLAVVADPKAVRRLEIKGKPKVGDFVRAKGVISRSEGTEALANYFATEIKAVKAGSADSEEGGDSASAKKGTKFKLTGEVTAIDAGVLTVGDTAIDIVSAKVKGKLALGVVVKVEGVINPETGNKIASKVEVSKGGSSDQKGGGKPSKKGDEESGKKSDEKSGKGDKEQSGGENETKDD